MNTKKVFSIILPLVPVAIIAAGLIYAIAVSLSGRWTEGGEWLAFFFFFVPAAAVIGIPLAIIALKLNKEEDLPFVKVLSAIEVILGAPIACLVLVMIVKTVFGLIIGN